MPPAESEPFVGKARCWLRGRECVLGGDSLLKHHSLPQKGPVPERGSLGNAWVVESSLLLGTLGALGGLLLGIIESMAKAYISTQLANSIVFAVLIVTLLVRPAGLLGKYVPEKV